MTEPLIWLNEFCHARLGAIGSFVASDLDKWVMALLITVRASWALQDNLWTFLNEYPFPDTRTVKLFLTGTVYEMVYLVNFSIQEIEVALSQHLDMIVHDVLRHGRECTVLDLIKLAKESCSNIRAHAMTAYCLTGLSPKLEVSPGEEVPTASPRELLLRILLNKPETIQKLLQDLPSSIANIGQHVSILTAPSTRRDEFVMRSNIPDGVPAMFFLCYHKATSRAPFILGANQENWGGLEPIQTIRREDRDHRLATYATLVEEAFNALRETEDAVGLPDGLHGKPGQIQLSETRKLAIEYMRENPAFLGRSLEIGQAFDGKLQSKQCCYACKGMMGYLVPANSFKEKDIEKYLCHFNWVKGGGIRHFLYRNCGECPMRTALADVPQEVEHLGH